MQRNNVTSGLAGLLEGLYTARQDNLNRQVQQQQLANQTRQIGFADPNAPIGENERLRAEMTAKAKAQAQLEAYRNMMSGGSGMFTPFPGMTQPQQSTIQRPNAQPAQTTDTEGVDPELLAMVQAAQKRGLKIGIQR